MCFFKKKKKPAPPTEPPPPPAVTPDPIPEEPPQPEAVEPEPPIQEEAVAETAAVAAPAAPKPPRAPKAESADEENSVMNINKIVDKPYEQMTFRELAGAPADAISGISKDDGIRLREAFNVKTIADLAKLKYVKWAQFLCLLAEAEEEEENG